METLNLTKGQRLDLTKTNPGLKIAAVGLGWDVKHGSGDDFDLDAFAMALESGKIKSAPADVLFFNSPKVSGKPTLFAGGLVHSGDNLTGAGDGDDETILVDFSKIPSNITEVIIAVNIYEAPARHQNFGMIENAFIRIYDFDTKQELCKYDLTEDYSANNGLVMGKLYLKDGEWKFQAIGEGKNGTITEIAQTFM